MIYFPLNLQTIKPAQLSTIAGSLKQGQVVVLPTDTVYGFSCLATNKQAIRRIQRLKGRDAKKPFIVLMADINMVKKYARVSIQQEKMLDQIWRFQKRPTTVILSPKNKLLQKVSGCSTGLAIRLPKLSFLIKILKAVDEPIISTSLNISGQPVIKNVKALIKHFPQKNNQPDLVIDGGVDRRRKPSRLIDGRFKNKFIIRQ